MLSLPKTPELPRFIKAPFTRSISTAACPSFQSSNETNFLDLSQSITLCSSTDVFTPNESKMCLATGGKKSEKKSQESEFDKSAHSTWRSKRIPSFLCFVAQLSHQKFGTKKNKNETVSESERLQRRSAASVHTNVTFPANRHGRREEDCKEKHGIATVPTDDVLCVCSGGYTCLHWLVVQRRFVGDSMTPCCPFLTGNTSTT